LLDDPAFRSAYDIMDSISLDPTDKRKFSLYTKEKYMRAEATAGAVPILPEYFYDPKGLMRSFSMHQLNEYDEL